MAVPKRTGERCQKIPRWRREIALRRDEVIRRASVTAGTTRDKSRSVYRPADGCVSPPCGTRFAWCAGTFGEMRTCRTPSTRSQNTGVRFRLPLIYATAAFAAPTKQMVPAAERDVYWDFETANRLAAVSFVVQPQKYLARGARRQPQRAPNRRGIFGGVFTVSVDDQHIDRAF
jgi:hypothetical protein